MNINIKNILLLVVCSMIIFSCEKDDGPVSTITEPQTYTFTGFTESMTVPEEAATYEFAFTFDDNQIYDAHVLISNNSEATATEDADFHLNTHAVDVSTLGGSGSFEITVDEDFLPEDSETVIFDLVGDAPFNLPTAQTAMALTIENKVYAPAIELDWDTSFEFEGVGTFNTCGNSDIDLLIFDEAGEEVSGFAGATGACPELIFADAITADGTYDLVANLFGDGGIPPLVGGGVDSFAINMVLTLFKGGVVAPDASTATYNSLDFNVDAFYSYTPADPDGENLITIGSIVVSGGEMALFNPDGTEVGRFD